MHIQRGPLILRRDLTLVSSPHNSSLPPFLLTSQFLPQFVTVNVFICLFCNVGLPQPTMLYEARELIFLITAVYFIFGIETGIWQHLIYISLMNEQIPPPVKFYKSNHRSAKR